MNLVSKLKNTGGIALLGSMLILLTPIVDGLYGGVSYAVYALGFVGLIIAAKAILRPASHDYLLFVGAGALAIVAAFATGGATFWIQLAGGGVILGAGLWRRFMTEPAGTAHTSPS